MTAQEKRGSDDRSPPMTEAEKEKKQPKYIEDDLRRKAKLDNDTLPLLDALTDPESTYSEKLDNLSKLQISIVPQLLEELAKTYPSLERSVVAARTSSAIQAVSKSIQDRKAAELEDNLDAHSPKFQMVLGWFMNLFKESMLENDIDSATVDNTFTALAGRLEGWEDKVNKSMKGVTQKALAAVQNPFIEMIKDQIPAKQHEDASE